MGMLQAYSSNVWPTVGPPQLPVEVRGERLQRIGPRASRRLNSNRPVGPGNMGEEWAVVQQAIAGNADAQEHLFARQTDRLYRTAFALLHNREDAEDALQDGLFQAYTSLHSFQGRSSFSTWLTRIVINSALMTRRRKSSRPEGSLDEILDNQREPHGAVDEQPGPEELYRAMETNALVEQHVRQLTPAMQAAFRLWAIKGLSTTESSEALGISANTFKSRVLRARRKLASELQQSLELGAIALVLRKCGPLQVKGSMGALGGGTDRASFCSRIGGGP
jgi:RNA polymerase sigma-70 factor, ECF subfamily